MYCWLHHKFSYESIQIFNECVSVSTSAFLGLSWPPSGEKNIVNKIN
jgi:hypothetical protein